ncbi:MAG TPA: hypothetical protein PLH27_10755 [bacterium]|nr:hypothetical protein [bacterium]HMY34984.1 hypothetical protein [bacterium]HMZ03630.1 hypothetical protein [bacterium]HNB08853.1 hypothetical protein [bacterium]HNB55547.1 hypothetical protein [bacterium]
MKKILTFLLFTGAISVYAQEVSKQLERLDPGTATANLDNFGKTHSEQITAAHQARLGELIKAGTIIIRQDTMITADKPVKIAFNWPVASGQNLKDKSVVKRDPQVMTLYPAKDPSNKDIPQRWQVTYKDGTVKAIQ